MANNCHMIATNCQKQDRYNEQTHVRHVQRFEAREKGTNRGTQKRDQKNDRTQKQITGDISFMLRNDNFLFGNDSRKIPPTPMLIIRNLVQSAVEVLIKILECQAVGALRDRMHWSSFVNTRAFKANNRNIFHLVIQGLACRMNI